MAFVTSNYRVRYTETESDSISGWIKVAMLKWVGPSTAAHKAEVTDAASGSAKSIAQFVAGADKEDCCVIFNPPMNVKDLAVSDLDSGRMYVYTV